MMRLHLASVAVCLLALSPAIACAELYYYRAPDGHRVLTDRPINEPGYYLVEERNTIEVHARVKAQDPIPAGGPPEFQHYIARAGARYHVDPALIEAIVQVESNFDPYAISRKGAAGLMQLMEDTAAHYSVANRFNAEQNIDVGVRHLKELLNRYQGSLPLALAAYNAGPSSVELYRGVPPFRETRDYIDKVLRLHEQIRRLRQGGQ